MYLDWDQPAQMPPGTFYKPKFFKYMQEEFLACQEGVGIIDMSSFSKILIKVLFFGVIFLNMSSEFVSEAPLFTVN